MLVRNFAVQETGDNHQGDLDAPIGGRDARQHVDVVGHQVPLQQVDPLLPAQVPQDLSDLPAELAVRHPLAVLWHDHHVVLPVLALPPDVGLALPVFAHDGPPFAHQGPSSSLKGDRLSENNAGTAEPTEFSPAELVASL